jgi:hypothetical protein
VAGDGGDVQARLVVEPLVPGDRGELEEVGQSRLVHGPDRDVIPVSTPRLCELDRGLRGIRVVVLRLDLLLLRGRESSQRDVVGEVRLDAGDVLHPSLVGGLLHRRHTAERSVLRRRDGGLLEVGDALRELELAPIAVEGRGVRVRVEMDELVSHDFASQC